MSLSSRLRQARIVIDDDTRRAHLAAIDDAIVESTRQPRRHGRALAVALAAVLLVPVVALAAERSEPGDFLYPVRQLIHQTLDRSQPPAEPTVEESALGEAGGEGPSRPVQDRAPLTQTREHPAEDQPVAEEEIGGGDRPDQEAETTREPITRPDSGDPDEEGSDLEIRPTTTTFPESDRGDRQP